ncbi:breast cancer anti-estrogen resistance protein 1 isoform X1 [Vanacampus margaritifer]
MSVPNVLAKALYDNAAETPDELSFRKGDILTVLERDTQGLDGWWLCSLHGRQGIVPGNRLKVLVGMYDKKQEHGSPSTTDPTSSCPTSQMQRPVHPQSGFTQPPTPPQYTLISAVYSTPNTAQSKPESVYMIPPLHGPKPSLQSLYHVPSGPSALPVKVRPEPTIKAPVLAPIQSEISGEDVYQVPPSFGLGIIQAASSVLPSIGKDVYQVPSSLEKSTWEDSKTLGKGVAATQAGSVYVYDTVKPDRDKYDLPPRHPFSTPQDVYDVPPTRDKYNTQVYDFPPTVSKDVSITHLIKEETYDVPSHLTKKKPQTSTLPGQYMFSEDHKSNIMPEDVYDVPPPTLTKKLGGRDKVSQPAQEIYNFPSRVHHGGQPTLDVYDFPREQEERGDKKCTNIYDVPPQVVRDAQFPSEDLHRAFKRLSASSTGSTLSNNSASSLDVPTITDNELFSSSPAPGVFIGKPLLLDLDPAMERLSRLQQAVELSVSIMMSFITSNWRSPDNLEGNLPAIHQAADRVCFTLRDFLEFSRGAVTNAGQATDRSLQTKLGRQVGKLEEVFQSLITQTQSLDAISWLHTELAKPQPGADVLDQLVMTVRGIPDDTKQLASFLHGNASLLFKRSHQQQLPLPPLPGGIGSHVTASESGSYQAGERINIQSRPLPSPPKFAAAEEEGDADSPYETTEEGWMEDYDYVHLQGKEEFEKSQKQLMEKGSIIKNKTQLEKQQIKQFERLEQEVSRPINNDMTGWVPSSIHPQGNAPTQNGSSKLCHADRQLLLFYLEQSEQNFTTVNNAIDAFLTAVNSNQMPKIFVAHSKLVILSAHKLVFIGDTLSRQAKSADVRAQVGQSSNTLCNKLKDIVISTKTAALQYPSPGAAREMSEMVRELAGCTQQFKMVLGQLLML